MFYKGADQKKLIEPSKIPQVQKESSQQQEFHDE
jgi:centromere protein J